MINQSNQWDIYIANLYTKGNKMLYYKSISCPLYKEVLKFQIPIIVKYDIKCVKNILACVWQIYFTKEEHIVTPSLTEWYFLKHG